MSFLKNIHKFNKIKSELNASDSLVESNENINADNINYCVTTSQKVPNEDLKSCSNRKSCINVHSTDLCQITEGNNSNLIEECNLEVLSLNKEFPSTSEDSLSNDDASVQKRVKIKQDITRKTFVPSSSKSVTGSRRPKENIESQPVVYSDCNIPNSTLYVIGSNPGEPKICYADPPKKISKTMKKIIRNMEKHRTDKSGVSEKTRKLTRGGILKDRSCTAECTGDSVLSDDLSNVLGTRKSINSADDNVAYPMTDFDAQNNQIHDKNVKFNTQVVIIHFTGDRCLGQSVETLCKEKDQQARNSELRKIFLTKYNELWSN